MPLINGMKMACEPCIRGHRSTKCTHAHERLMVPVRKPGRPLSQCPHPRDLTCGCGTVTAAIPRKQTCGCGSNNAVHSESSSPQTLPQNPPQATNIPSLDAPSPTRSSFKVQKTRPQSSRKQSFDPSAFERMDMSSVNLVPFEQRQPIPQMAMPNGYPIAAFPQAYGYMPSYPAMHPHVGHFPMPPPPLSYIPDTSLPHHDHLNGFSNGITHDIISHKLQGQVATPKLGNTKSERATNGISSCCQPKQAPELVKEIQMPTNGESCCGPNRNGHSHSSSSSSNRIPEEPIQASCCAPKPSQQMPKQEPVSTNGTPMLQPQMLPQNGMPFNPALYQQYVAQPTVFTYPPTYGSFQNPLQPEAWRESMRTSNYGQTVIPQSDPLSYDASIIQSTVDTIHTCNCGDSCACIGCAAHPYNEETQNYIRSAWESMSLEHQAAKIYKVDHQATAGEMPAPPANGDLASSPTAHTPSSVNSANGEEQSLSAADFFFVSYPFTGEGCGGDTQSCPCGDDCQCLGCTIHNQNVDPAPPLS